MSKKSEGKPSTRRTASPKAALARRQHAPASEFFQRVGRLMYGPDWKDTFIGEVSRLQDQAPTIGTQADLAWNTRETILLALASGAITACVPLTVSILESVSKDGHDDDLADDDVVEDDDIGNPTLKQKIFKVNRLAWATSAGPLIDWARSIVTLDLQSLDSISNFILPPVQDVPIWILNPDESLRRVFIYTELPDDDWFGRYSIYRSRFFPELIACGWRFLLITDAKRSDPRLNSLLVQAMQEYLLAQNVGANEGPQQAALSEIARRLALMAELEIGVSTEIPTNTLASSLCMRWIRRRVLKALLAALHPYGWGNLRVFTLVNEGWVLTPEQLEATTAARIKAQFRTHLTRAGIRADSGFLLAFLHAEFDPISRLYTLHFHGVTTAEVAALLQGLVGKQGYNVTRTGSSALWRQPVKNPRRQLSYLLKAYWPSRRVKVMEDGSIVRVRRKTRIVEPFHTQSLLWLDRQRLIDLTVMNGGWSPRLGGNDAMRTLFLIIQRS